MSFININGKITDTAQAQLPYNNKAFRYGYGLFETMLCINGELLLQNYHWERLFAGCATLEFQLPKLMTQVMLEWEVKSTIEKNKFNHLCRVRLQLYGGCGGMFEIDHTGFIIECFSLEENILLLNENGLAAGIATAVRKNADATANLKTSNALIYMLAAKEAQQQKWNDALVVNNDNHIIESTIANIFWIKNGIIHTPSLSEGCVAGVMRRYIINTLAAQKTTVVETELTRNTLQEADEVFLSNAIRRIKWVKTIGDREYENQHTRRLYQMLFSK